MSSEKNSCCGGPQKPLIMSCAGGANTGQVANRVMVELDQAGTGSAYCLAGLGADLSGFIASSKAAETIVIDGCPVSCAKKTLARHGIEPDHYFIVTELGIEKKHDYSALESETATALSRVAAGLK